MFLNCLFSHPPAPIWIPVHAPCLARVLWPRWCSLTFHWCVCQLKMSVCVWWSSTVSFCALPSATKPCCASAFHPLHESTPKIEVVEVAWSQVEQVAAWAMEPHVGSDCASQKWAPSQWSRTKWIVQLEDASWIPKVGQENEGEDELRKGNVV